MSTDKYGAERMSKYLESTSYYDFESKIVSEYGEKLVGSETDPVKIAVRLYLGVRDEVKYNAYTFEVKPESFSASYCLEQGESYCVPKAVLLGALCRLYKIPARIGLADVRNHLASPQFLEYLQSDVFVMHGYTDIFLEDQWVKATPAFDSGLCKLMNLQPLEFNGKEDSIFHEFDNSGDRHMEYLKEHGHFEDVPRELILSSVAEAYPHLVESFSSAKPKRSLYLDMQEQ